MKKINQSIAACLCLLLLIFSVRPAQAQIASKATFEKAIITDFCDTFTKSASHINKENMTAELGMMILPLFTKYKDQIESEWGLSAGNTTDLRSMGEKIGQLAALNCPAFQTFIKANLQEFTKDREEGSSKTVSGKSPKWREARFRTCWCKTARAGQTNFTGWNSFPVLKNSVLSPPVT